MQRDLAVLVRGFAATIPGRDTNLYRAPSDDDLLRMEQAMRAILREDLISAAAAADPVGYDVERFLDAATGRSMILMSERLDENGVGERAWGLYVHAPDPVSPLTVEVPHPVHDANTEMIGVEAFRLGGGANLFIAGAHRHAASDCLADVAHQPRSVFDALHRLVLGPDTIVFQPHGFESGGARSTWDAVVSAGDVRPDLLALEVASELRRLGLRVVLYDGKECPGLGGTRNVQGLSTRAAGASFLHLELSYRVRSDPSLSGRVASVVAGTTAPEDWSRPLA